MAEQPQRSNAPDGAGSPPSAPPSPVALTDAAHDIALDNLPPPSDDTPTIISKIQPRPDPPDNLFSGILRGRKLAHFELIEPIGVGGMAAVLRARDTQLERTVALKILPPEMASDPENVARFHQEARAAARLDHETIARVFYCGEDQSLHFIAFEFVEGENLRTLIDRRGPLPVPEALHYMLQVATGLAHASERGVVHRDIKPSNIIISPNGRAKLVDMGLARNLGPQTDDGLTHSGVTLGTFDYISPEQALEPRDADGRSDIYSLGCTFYHALTGRAPVPEGTAAKKLHHHQHVPPIDPRQLNPDIPDEVAAILGRMMAKDPRQRYQRPEHLVQHLLQATQRLGGPEGPEGVLFVDAALPEPPRARPLLVVGCAAAIVVALVVLVGPSRDSRTPWGLGPGAGPVQPADASQSPAVAGPQPGDGGADDPGGQKHDTVVPKEDTPVRKEVASWKDLTDLATAGADKSYLIIVKKDLWPDAAGFRQEQDVVLKGKKITLMGEDGRAPPVIWSRFVAAKDRKGGLVLEADVVALRRLRLVADSNNSGPSALAAGLFVTARQSASFTECEFLQGNGLRSPEVAYNSVAVVAPRGGVQVRFDRCCFLGGKEVKRPAGAPGADGAGWLTQVSDGGQTAVAVKDVASVSADNCAFGPHATLFRVEGRDTKLALRRCTAMAGNEWALASLVGERTSATVQPDHCLFARVTTPAPAMDDGMTERNRPRVCLVRLLGKDSALTKYDGSHNRYLNVEAVQFAAGDNAGQALAFKDDLIMRGCPDEKVLTAAPWKAANPLDLLEGPLSAKDLLPAFRLDFGRVPDLAVQESDPPAVAGVGMEKSPWGPAWTATDLEALGGGVARVKTVDPGAKTDPDRGLYESLEDAKPKPGDVIRIRCNMLRVDRTQLVQAGAGVTIQAAENCHPVLVLGNTGESQAALFNVQGGHLTLEGLEFRLRPNGNSNFDAQAVAKVGGEGSVTFRKCVVTLNGQEAATPLSVVLLPNFRDAIMSKDAGGIPKILIDNCFIRGDGDLVAARASRPFEMDVRDSLAVLKGSVLNLEADQDKAPEGKEIALRLDRLTAYLGGHLARLKATNLSSLLPVRCAPSKSWLVSGSGRRKALLHLEAGPQDDKEARRRFPWDASNFVYANFSTMLDQQQPGEKSVSVMMADRMGSDTSSRSDVKIPEWVGLDRGDSSLANVSPSPSDLKAEQRTTGPGMSTMPPSPAPTEP
jgi:hypothetical protein